jgi:hypothetical protein
LAFKVQPEDPLVPEVDVLVELEDPAGANLTASAQVDLELERDSMTTFACVVKL